MLGGVIGTPLGGESGRPERCLQSVVEDSHISRRLLNLRLFLAVIRNTGQHTCSIFVEQVVQ